MSIRCQVSVSHDNIPDLTHTFQLRRDHILVHSSTTADDSVVYKLSPARVADSGNYECRVKVKDKSKACFGQKLDVTGKKRRGNKTFLKVGFICFQLVHLDFVSWGQLAGQKTEGGFL